MIVHIKAIALKVVNGLREFEFHFDTRHNYIVEGNEKRILELKIEAERKRIQQAKKKNDLSQPTGLDKMPQTLVAPNREITEVRESSEPIHNVQAIIENHASNNVKEIVSKASKSKSNNIDKNLIGKNQNNCPNILSSNKTTL